MGNFLTDGNIRPKLLNQGSIKQAHHHAVRQAYPPFVSVPGVFCTYQLWKYFHDVNGEITFPGIACPFLPEDAPIPPRGPLRGPISFDAKNEGVSHSGFRVASQPRRKKTPSSGGGLSFWKCKIIGMDSRFFPRLSSYSCSRSLGGSGGNHCSPAARGSSCP